MSTPIGTIIRMFSTHSPFEEAGLKAIEKRLKPLKEDQVIHFISLTILFCLGTSKLSQKAYERLSIREALTEKLEESQTLIINLSLIHI